MNNLVNILNQELAQSTFFLYEPDLISKLANVVNGDNYTEVNTSLFNFRNLNLGQFMLWNQFVTIDLNCPMFFYL